MLTVAHSPAAAAVAGDLGRARAALAGKLGGRVAPERVAAAGRTLAQLTPLGFPFVVPLSGGRLTIAAADLTPYWGACLPTDTPDPQDLLAGLSPRAASCRSARPALTRFRRGCSRTGLNATCASTRTCPRS